MRHTDYFSLCHPAVSFAYFALVLALSMCLMHPAALAASLVSALTYSIYLRGRRAVRFCLVYMLPMLLLTALVNPAFSHEGATILAYLPSGNPLTLESVAYGLAAAAMLAAVVVWFTCCSEIMTSDKLVYLFGRVAPSLSLVLSMTLRFVPRFVARMRAAADARRGMGSGASAPGALKRTKNAAAVLSATVTWALENAVETADSMKSRGYGLPGRTAFSIYRFDDRDRTALLWLTFCAVYIISGSAAGGLYFRYYPTVRGAEPSVFSASLLLCYLSLCLTPMILNIKEDVKWRRLRSGS